MTDTRELLAQAYRLCFGPPGDAVDGRSLVKVLAVDLARAGVRDTSIIEIVTRANERCSPGLPGHELTQLLQRTMLQAAEDRGVAMGPIDIGTDEGKEKLRQSAAKRAKSVESPVAPLKAFVRATLQIERWNPHSYELEAMWHETGEIVRLPIGNTDVRQLQRAVGESIGGLGVYVRQAHSAAKPSMLLDVLWGRVKGTPRSEAGEEDSQPVRLFWALYEANVWLTKMVGDKPSKTLGRLCDNPDVYSTAGVGIVELAKFGKSLVVNLDKAAPMVLRQHPDFGRCSVAELREMLQRAPGYGGRCQSRQHKSTSEDGRAVYTFRDTRWHRLSIGEVISSDPSPVSPPSPAENQSELPLA